MDPEAAPPALSHDFDRIDGYNEGDVEQLLLQTCRVLSTLTRYTAMAAPPGGEEARLRSVHLAQMADTSVLMVAVLDNGRVVHRLVELAAPLPPREVSRLSNALDRMLRGASRSTLSTPSPVPRELAAHEEALRTLTTALRRGLDERPEELYLQGTSHILEQPEFREADRVEPLIRLLEERRTAYEKLREMLAERNLTVVIGAENPHDALRECSVVLARYRAGTRMSGWVGILGPTRLHYQCAVPAVRFAARALTEAFTRMGLA
jgi:heat-inducible transcriptional repressor